MVRYPIVIEAISDEDGGGYMAFFPDLPGCMSDGETPAEAVESAMDALECWLAAQTERGAPIPEPGAAQAAFCASMEEMTDEMDRLSSELDKAKDRILQLEKVKTHGWQPRQGRGGYMRQLAFG